MCVLFFVVVLFIVRCVRVDSLFVYSFVCLFVCLFDWLIDSLFD